MIEIGKYNTLEVIKELDFGLYLSESLGEEEILLPIKYVKAGTKIGDKITVFVYFDSEKRPIATTLKPFAEVDEFAFLTVVDKSDFGAFLDLGIAKDILAPIREQAQEMRLGREYVVFLYIDDKTGRILASSKWNKFIDQTRLNVVENQEVDLFIAERTDLGFKAIINQLFIGLIYHNEIFEPIKIGDKKRGFIKKIREENKIDLSLKPKGFSGVLSEKDSLLSILKSQGGKLSLHDKSSPEEIYETVKMSKKSYKKLIGALYKDGIISIEENEIKLIGE
ncbi:MAG: hypothetical protein EAZ53_13500 [Bacteroidetes bacterium]|nr:MAG: hypothetical protein EAZ53_13500 [Bacteroidota bacterium]